MSEQNSESASSIVGMLEGNPIVFIGAGLSIPPYKTWDGLLQDLESAMGYEASDKSNPIQAAQEVFDQNPEKFMQSLVSIFAPLPSECRPALREIANIDFKAYLTTNFDQTLELAFKCARKTPAVTQVYPALQASLCDHGALHYIHGRVSAQTNKPHAIVLHKESYENAYSETGLLPNYLFDIFYSNDVIFTGYGLNKNEPINHILKAVLRTIKFLRKRLSISEKERKIILPSDCDDPELIQRLNELNIEILNYDKIDDDHSGLDDLWAKVSLALGRQLQDKPFAAYDPFHESDPIIEEQ